MKKKKVELDIDDKPATKGKCDWCGKEKFIYARGWYDPYETELYPEKPLSEVHHGDWCELCFENRSESV